MYRLTRSRYWFLGIVALMVCLWGRPAIAQLSLAGVPRIEPEPIQVAQANAPTSLEAQARSAYSQERYQAAVALLQQAQQQAQAQGDAVAQAILLSNLSLSQQQLGDWAAAETALTQAWQVLNNQIAPQSVEAQILDVQGRLAFARGDLITAVDTWQKTANLYDQIGDTPRRVLSQLHRARAQQAQGLFQQVFRTLKQLETDLASQPDSVTKITLLRQLGDSQRATGRLKSAEQSLQKSLQVAQALEDIGQIAATTLSLGNLEQAKFQVAVEKDGRTATTLVHANAALDLYQQAAQLDDTTGVQARLNLMQLLTNPAMAQWETAIAFYPAIQDRLAQLPPSRSTLYGYTGLAENLILLKQHRDRATLPWSAIETLLATARTQAEALGDSRAQSQVFGTLGYLYEQTQQWAAAEAFSRQALTLARQIRADDISYRWQWQLGRILSAQGQSEAAITAYNEAFSSLRNVRSDLITANLDIRFSFRESVEPVFRELVDLLLVSVPSLQSFQPVTAQAKTTQIDQAHSVGTLAQASSNQAQSRLRQARDVMEALQLAQLENYFQAACLDNTDAATITVDQAVNATDPTAIVYSILLPDRLEVVLKFPQQADLVHYSAPVPRRQIDETLSQFRTALITGAPVESYGRDLYDWMLRPAAAQGLLSPDTVDTLVFVLDGNLRLLPMATLHDGEGFLIEKYAVSLILGLEVKNPAPLPPRDQMQVLAASLTDPPAAAAAVYGRLENVDQEVTEIVATGLATKTLKDAAFTRKALAQQLQATDYTIVHLATHGQFGSDRDNTFILAADGPITVNQLGQLFDETRRSDVPLELLILSACKTATGNSREVLGIAGATVQAGARSSIATLWSVDDAASVQFTQTLYRHLGQPGVSRAEALRLAQVDLAQRFPGRPRYWAPYVLVGSWR